MSRQFQFGERLATIVEAAKLMTTLEHLARLDALAADPDARESRLTRATLQSVRIELRTLVGDLARKPTASPVIAEATWPPPPKRFRGVRRLLFLEFQDDPEGILGEIIESRRFKDSSANELPRLRAKIASLQEGLSHAESVNAKLVSKVGTKAEPSSMAWDRGFAAGQQLALDRLRVGSCPIRDCDTQIAQLLRGETMQALDGHSSKHPRALRAKRQPKRR